MMKYRKFKTVDREISLLGMGVMRLPHDAEGTVDEQVGIDLVRYSIDHGINYIDTGYTYHGGKSEKIIGMALKDGYREKILLADKLPIWLAETEEDLDRYFNEQIERLDVERIDMYLNHNLEEKNWKIARDTHAYEFLEKKKAEGKIGRIGFSFHGDYELFREIIDTYPWEFCQIQLNYVDRDEQATLRGLEYAREKGIDVIVMEPLKGGRISDKVPPSVQRLWDKAAADGIAPPERTAAEWAFRWVASQPGVSLVLSGMSSFEQLDENIRVFSAGDFPKLSGEELAVVDEVTAEYKRKIKYGCTGCGYCMPCPRELDIPGLIGYLNVWYAYDRNPSTKGEYTTWQHAHASDCIHCKACEAKCPQSLPISDIMTETAEAFGV